MHSSRFKYEISLISIVQPTNRTKHKTKQNKKNQTHKPTNPQSNSPFSLVLRDPVDSKLAVAWSKLAVAWSKLLAKADWDREWVWLREQWDGEAGSVSDLETDLCEVRAWECESVCGSALCERKGEGEGQWECRLICVRVRRYFWI